MSYSQCSGTSLSDGGVRAPSTGPVRFRRKATLITAWFMDVTSSRGVHFQYLASHTSRKYLPETMGAGVALFDYDNDGRLDLFLVNGALLADPTAKGTVPEKSGPEYWNRLFHPTADGTFQDVT